MRERTILQRALDAFRRRERLAIAVWLAGWSLALVALAVYGIALQGAERWVDGSSDRWAARVAEAEALVAAGRWDAAARRLERLDREHPARGVLHARDRERERVLELLGTAYLELDRRRRARDTFDALVDFDPLNWANHWARATAAARLGDADAALEGYLDVLALHPTHLPSVSAAVGVHTARGDFGPVLGLWEAYLDAWRLAPFELRFFAPGADEPAVSVTVDVPTDAEPHEARATVALPAGWQGTLEVASGGYTFELVSVTLTPPVRAGVLSAPDAARRTERPVPAASAGVEAAPDGVLLGRDRGARARFALAVPPGGVETAAVTLRAFKTADAATWAEVERSYANQIAHEGRARARARTRVGGIPEAGSLFGP